MVQVRVGVFETNSSSTHSFTWATEEEYQKYCNGELFIALSTFSAEAKRKFEGKRFITVDELRELVKLEDAAYSTGDNFNSETATVEELAKYARENDIADSYSQRDEWLDWYDEHFTTPSGDKIVCFGEYGRDG